MAIPQLENKLVFITGAASGIGAATARVFAEQGCRLVLADLSEQLLQDTVNNVRCLTREVHPIALDVSDQQQFEQVAQTVCERIGVPHVLINNAGIGALGSFLNTPIEEVRKVMDVNFWGVLNGCRAFLPRMQEAGEPRHLANVASMASISPAPNMSAYAASKFAVHGLTEVIAMELHHSDIGVSCVHPGVINTPIAQAQSYNPDGAKQAQRLSQYYQANGSNPRVVAGAILKAVQTGRAHTHTGAGARLTAIMKRISPRLTRKLTMSAAEKMGYA
ncbi:MAG: SDR family NAD(P)-dependent oxidoreductase [Halieaceae bacterium]